MDYRSNISKEEVNDLETGQFNGRIWIVEDSAGVQKAVKKLSQHNTIGFDTETKPSFKKGHINDLSLIQLATPTDAFLIRSLKTGLPESLRQLFENEDILKVGVAIRDDIRKIRKLNSFVARGFLELQEYTGFFKIEDNSLRKLAAIVLGIKVSKSQQLSNWEAPKLDDAQAIYAATDAWACLEIYNKLRNSLNNYGKSQDHS